MSLPVILTLMSDASYAPDDVAAASAAIAAAGGTVTAESAFDPPYAVDIVVRGLQSSAVRTLAEAACPQLDVVAQASGPDRIKALLLADMDSTMIGQECIDELADFAGLKDEIAAITDSAMRGDLDFAEALKARVAALAGLDAAAIDRCLAERITLTPGARTLIATMNALGCRTVLVSGGFTAFTAPIAARIGFHRQVANALIINDGRLTGTVAEPIVDSVAKRATLEAERAVLGVSASATMAVGDGANDIPMLRAAGLGIAYHAKPTAAAAADAAVRHGDLTALLWAQGIPRARWVQP